MKPSYIIASVVFSLSVTAAAQNNRIIVTTPDGTISKAITETTTGTFADVEGVETLMIDGNAVAPVKDVTNIRFVDAATLPFTITNPEGMITDAYESIPALFRVIPSGDVTSTQIGFGTVAAAEPAGLADGEYGIYLSLSASAINAGGITDLTGSQSYSLKLYKYEDAQAVDSLTEVTGGSISYNWRATRRQLTLNINATFSDGTTLKAEYSGTPTDVESVAEMVPEKVYGNELVIIDGTGSSSTSYAIQSVRKSSVSTYNTARYPGTKFTFSSDSFYDTMSLEFKDEAIVDKGTLSLTSFDSEVFYIRFGSIQLYPSYESTEGSYPYKNHVDNGTIRVDKLSDNEYEIFVDFVNSYTNYSGSELGTKEHYTLHWKGTVN